MLTFGVALAGETSLGQMSLFARVRPSGFEFWQNYVQIESVRKLIARRHNAVNVVWVSTSSAPTMDASHHTFSFIRGLDCKSTPTLGRTKLC